MNPSNVFTINHSLGCRRHRNRLSLLLLSLQLLLSFANIFPTVQLFTDSMNFPGKEHQVTSVPGVNFTLNYHHYSGYLEPIEGTFIHYWFFESQTNHRDKDPVVVWLTGGPGCSSLHAALSENGPLRLLPSGEVVNNPNAWNRNANILYLESPSGVGFSFESKKQYHTNDRKTAMINFYTLNAFFDKFPHLMENDFYITGESYAGVFVPTLAELVINGQFPSNFKGIAIGNGLLDKNRLQNSRFHFMYHHGLVGVAEWDTLIRSCCANVSTAELRRCDIAGNKAVKCVTAQKEFRMIVDQYNIYDSTDSSSDENSFGKLRQYHHHDHHAMLERILRQKYNLQPQSSTMNGELDGGGDGLLKQEILGDEYIAKWLNRKDVQQALHVTTTPMDGDGWKVCSDKVNSSSYVQQYANMHEQIYRLVKNGIRTVIYNGDVDTVCDFIGNQWFVEDLGFTAAGKFSPWFLENFQVGGFAKRYVDGQLIFTTILGAGHMVPHDKPKPALKVFENFLLGLPSSDPTEVNRG